MPHRIALLVFPGFQILDAAGPMAAFEVAARLRQAAYTLRTIASQAGAIASSSGLELRARPFGRIDAVDTLVVAGGEGAHRAAQCLRTRQFVLACAARAQRVASVCSGAYVLAAAGLLDGRRATTHWNCTAHFKEHFPRVRLEPDRIYVRDGRVWSSAGITAGIDLALAMIEADLGETVARRTAQQLVVYHRRPGGQSQFSPLLAMERAVGRFTPLLEHARAHLHTRLDVESLAAWSCMSPRHFARLFSAEIGLSPAKAVERLRVDAARAALESGTSSVQQVAVVCGFGDSERMRRSFLRVLGTPPSALKRREGPR